MFLVPFLGQAQFLLLCEVVKKFFQLKVHVDIADLRRLLGSYHGKKSPNLFSAELSKPAKLLSVSGPK